MEPAPIPEKNASGTLKTVVMDKTGTITKGNFVVQTILPAGTASEQEILQIAAACETASTHPIGVSIVSAAKDQNLVIEKPAEIEEISGKGIHARLSQGEVLCVYIVDSDLGGYRLSGCLAVACEHSGADPHGF